jgi:predicted membrane GTPase involved in stress response
LEKVTNAWYAGGFNWPFIAYRMDQIAEAHADMEQNRVIQCDGVLDVATEYIGPEDLVEATPTGTRMRKRELNADSRSKVEQRRKRKRERENALG